jgi:hypothetical protein
MSFINEKMTPEQREEFRKRGIKKLSSEYIANPIYRTIDKDNKMCLWDIGIYSRDDFHTHGFLFDCNGETHTVIMDYSNPENGNVHWSISTYEKIFTGKESFAENLKEALTVYAVNGYPEQRGKTIVEVKFLE